MLFAVFLIVSCGSAGDAEIVATIEDTPIDTNTEIPVVTRSPLPLPDSVIYRGASTMDILTLDPQIAADPVSITYIESLFVNLTNYDLRTAAVVPEAATGWEISADGLTYTFYLRSDIPWVFHNPETGETSQVRNSDGVPMFVTAGDFVNAIQRACNPTLGSYYSTVIAPQILGCDDVLLAEDPESLTDEDYEAIGAYALDDATLVIELAFPASYFISMTSMWTLAAIPQTTIDEYRDGSWIEAGTIVTNGRYVLSEWVRGVRSSLIRNPLIPADMTGGGNIEEFQINIVSDVGMAYDLWMAGKIETSDIPDGALQTHLDKFPDETDKISDQAVFYIAFAHDQPPFDDVRVRAAFSAAFDRELFIKEVRRGQGLPIKHLAPPGIFGAPNLDEVGVGYDPEYAAAKLAEAGYPECNGFPEVTLVGYPGVWVRAWIEFAQFSWKKNLGCSKDLFQTTQLTFDELPAVIAQNSQDRPNMWILGWGTGYADENNWVGDVLWCGGRTNTNRACTVNDELIVQAREELDPAVRIILYRQIEEGFFGLEGEFPLAPIFLRIRFVARHPWLSRIPALFGGDQLYTWVIDEAMRIEMNP